MVMVVMMTLLMRVVLIIMLTKAGAMSDRVDILTAHVGDHDDDEEEEEDDDGDQGGSHEGQGGHLDRAKQRDEQVQPRDCGSQAH